MKKAAVIPIIASMMLIAGCSFAPHTSAAETASAGGSSPTVTNSPGDDQAEPDLAEQQGSTSPESPQDLPAVFDARHLGDAIDEIISEAGDYRVGVAVADVSDEDVLTFGDTSRFFAASTAKVLTALAYYTLVEAGEASLEEMVGSYSAGAQIEFMINRSNNDSWLLLMKRIGYSNLSDYAASLGIVYDPEENLLTVTEMAQVIKQLSSGSLLSEHDTDQLLGFMQDTNNERLIPSAVSSEMTVHHKYGRIAGNLHDAALLYSGDSTIVLVIYTQRNEPGTPAGQRAVIRAVTRTVEKNWAHSTN